MGDHRATIKIEFSMYGETRKMDSWINWSRGGIYDPVDDRVIAFFAKAYEEMRAIHDEAEYEAQREAREKEQERAERAELERLKAKYEPASTPNTAEGQ